MWNASDGTDTLHGASASLVRMTLGVMAEALLGRRSEPLAVGIRRFDALAASQQAAVLADVGEALVREDVPAPELSAVNEATVAAIFKFMESRVRDEVERSPSSTRWRRSILDAARQFEDLSGPSEEPLPEETDMCFANWEELVEVLSLGILWDNDWDHSPFEDYPPDAAEEYCKLMGVDRVAPGNCSPGAPTDPYVLALEHTVPRTSCYYVCPDAGTHDTTGRSTERPESTVQTSSSFSPSSCPCVTCPNNG